MRPFDGAVSWRNSCVVGTFSRRRCRFRRRRGALWPARAGAGKEQDHGRRRRQDALLLPAADDRRAQGLLQGRRARRRDPGLSRAAPGAAGDDRRQRRTSCPAPTSTRSRSRRRARTSRPRAAGQVFGDRARDAQGEGRRLQVAGRPQGHEDRRDRAGFVDQHVRQRAARESRACRPDAVSIIGAGATAAPSRSCSAARSTHLANLDPVIASSSRNGDVVAVVDTRTSKGMQDVYGDAYAAGCIYVPVDFAKKVSEHDAGVRQRDDACIAFHPDSRRRTRSSRPCRRLLHRQGACTKRRSKESRDLQARRRCRDRSGRSVYRDLKIVRSGRAERDDGSREDVRHVVRA